MKKPKMRAEKPCRTPVSEFQTEPYSESYGQKPFGRAPSKSSHGHPGGGEQVPPAVLFFENKDLFYMEALAALYRLPPAGRFFEKWTPKNTSFDVVVQVASGGSFF